MYKLPRKSATGGLARDLVEHKIAARPPRDLAVDFYRVSGVVLIVLGHWLAASVTYHDGRFGRQNPLIDLPWTQWLTWPFQAVPVFFLVAGYAGAASWARRYSGDAVSRQDWHRRRLGRVLGPAAVYVGLMSVTVVILDISGVAGSVLAYAGWALAMHLWFLAVYLVVVSLTPIAIAAHRRWGLLASAALGMGVVLVDAISRAGHIPLVGWLNYLLCWGLLYQLGIAWHGGLLSGRKPAVLAAASAGILALLMWAGLYPASMIGVPGQAVQNTTPPSVALVAFGCTQTGLAVALAPALNRALRFSLVQRVLSTINSNVMALYLWHLVPLVIVAIIGYPTGLLPQPMEGTAPWWLARLEWVVVLSLVTAVELAFLWLLRKVFAAPLPTVGVPVVVRYTEPAMLFGVAMATYGLAFLSAYGFAPDGHFPWMTVLVFAIGLALVAARPRQSKVTDTHV